MASAVDVAHYLIHLANAEEERDPLSPMRLQKLLYYVQGWSFGALGCPLFEGRIEAWKHGPVIREVYYAFKACGDQGIPPDHNPEALSLRDRAFIESVWAEYKKYSCSGLRAMTHSEQPWLDARGGLPEDASSDAEITPEALQAFFSPRAIELAMPGLSVESTYVGFEQFRQGQGRPAKEVFARIRSRHAL